MPDINGLPTPDELKAQNYTPAQIGAVRNTGSNLSVAGNALGRGIGSTLAAVGNDFVGGVNAATNGLLGLFGIDRHVGEDYLASAAQHVADGQSAAADFGRNVQNAVATGMGGTMQPAGLAPVALPPVTPAVAGAPVLGSAVGKVKPTAPAATPQTFRIPDKYDAMVDKATGATRGNVTLPVPTRTGSTSNGITFGLPPVGMRASPGIASTPFVGLGYNPNNVVDPNQKTQEEILASRIGALMDERDHATSVLSDNSVLGRAQQAPGAVTRAKLVMDNATGLAQSLYGVMGTGQQVASKAITDVATSNADNQTKIADRQLANNALLQHAQIAGQYGLLGEEAKANAALSAKMAEMQSKVMSESGVNAKNLAEAGIINSRHQYALNAMDKDPQLAAWLLLNNMPETKVTVDPNGGVYKTGPGTVVRVPTTEEINKAKAGK